MRLKCSIEQTSCGRIFGASFSHGVRRVFPDEGTLADWTNSVPPSPRKLGSIVSAAPSVRRNSVRFCRKPAEGGVGLRRVGQSQQPFVGVPLPGRLEPRLEVSRRADEDDRALELALERLELVFGSSREVNHIARDRCLESG
jgi:hypothetical protein